MYYFVLEISEAPTSINHQLYLVTEHHIKNTNGTSKFSNGGASPATATACSLPSLVSYKIMRTEGEVLDPQN